MYFLNKSRSQGRSSATSPTSDTGMRAFGAQGAVGLARALHRVAAAMNHVIELHSILLTRPAERRVSIRVEARTRRPERN